MFSAFDRWRARHLTETDQPFTDSFSTFIKIILAAYTFVVGLIVFLITLFTIKVLWEGIKAIKWLISRLFLAPLAPLTTRIWSLMSRIVYWRDRNRAADPATSSSDLEKLAASFDLTTRQLVAKNSSSPPNVLLELIYSFPKAVSENPIFAHMLGEQPKLIAAMPSENLLAILKQPNLPDLFLVGAAAHSNIAIAKLLVENPNSSEQVLERLGTMCSVAWICDAILVHPNATPALCEKLAAQGNAIMQERCTHFGIMHGRSSNTL